MIIFNSLEQLIIYYWFENDENDDENDVLKCSNVFKQNQGNESTRYLN